ncbi:hypothetical protein WS63_08350 [Burkholderia stagnalis]|uniref:hypothetical protein n=1 Tax=Burkholderia stagnalis TaxID=1503054 RepID=UPI000770D418|nr:hypothetical protein [Burkholderia stagnalis]KVD93034.1 hypothetical protein WS63_08350 [Burkholderia stagnalis]
MTQRSEAVRMAVQSKVFEDDDRFKTVEGYWVVETEGDGSVCGVVSGTLHATREDAEKEMAGLNSAARVAVETLDNHLRPSEATPEMDVASPLIRSKAGSLMLAASRSPEHVREIAGQMLGRPVSVTVVASHRAFPEECHADGVMFPDGRVVVDSPFKWVREIQYLAAPTYQSIGMSHVVLPDGQELDDGWQEIGYDEISATDFADLQRRVEALEMAIARGEELPTTDALLARFQHVMDRSRWMIDMDSGKVVEARWDAEDPPKNVAPHIVVSLPDGYNGHTLNFVGVPVECDGNHVKLKCAERGREYMIRWISDADLQSAIDSQVANAKAWEYRDEKEGVSFQSLDRLPAEKREQWTSERPLDAVPASLVGLGVEASDQAAEMASKPRMRP